MAFDGITISSIVNELKGDIAGIQIDALFFGEIRKEIWLLGRHLV